MIGSRGSVRIPLYPDYLQHYMANPSTVPTATHFIPGSGGWLFHTGFHVNPKHVMSPCSANDILHCIMSMLLKCIWKRLLQ